MSEIPEGLYYSEKHEWVKVEGDSATIGVTDFAQASMGDIVYLELGEVDSEISQEGSMGTIESVKSAEDIYAPISGKILEVNSELIDEPAQVNQTPYESWLVKLSIQDSSELDSLMDSSAYSDFIKTLE